ncbi:MAG: CocE/NonD family hydrolase, partial [Roseinatronobacter sp.]
EAGTGQDFVQFRIDTFRRRLLGADLPSGPRVRYFVMGGGDGHRNDAGRMSHGGAWHVADTWPPENSAPTSLFLGAAGTLSDTPPESSDKQTFRFDPENPVPTIGGPITSGAPLMVGGAFDQIETRDLFGATSHKMPLASRADVLVFETLPLTRAITIAGDVSVQLFISSDRPTTDITAKLVDVYPPTPDYPHGFAMNLSDGILRTCYRDGFEQQRTLPDGDVVAITVRLYPIANRFEIGHRVRLEISSSNFPRFDINPNHEVGHDLSAVKFSALNSVHFGPDHPSCLQISVLSPEF